MTRTTKVCIILLCCIAVLHLYGTTDAGISIQNQQILDAVSSCFKRNCVYNYSAQNLGRAIKDVIQKESKCLGSSLNVNYTVKNGYRSQQHIFNILHTFSSDPVCKITVEKTRNSYKTFSQINPNCDGCLINSDTGKLHIGDKLETVFVMDTGWSKKIRVGTERDFNRRSRFVYKVCQYPSVNQKKKGLCGFGSLFNILNLKEHRNTTHCDFMLDRSKFEDLVRQGERYIRKKRWYRRGDGITNIDLQNFINNEIRQLCKKNVIISLLDIDDRDINNLYYRKYNIFGAGSIWNRIRDFQRNGTTQYLIVQTSTKKEIRGITLDWKDINGRKACLPNHWIALKIAWKGEPMNSPVIITIADSGGPRDNRYVALIASYYDLFVHYKGKS